MVIREVVPLHKPKRGEGVEALEGEKNVERKRRERETTKLLEINIFSQLYHKNLKDLCFKHKVNFTILNVKLLKCASLLKSCCYCTVYCFDFGTMVISSETLFKVRAAFIKIFLFLTLILRWMVKGSKGASSLPPNNFTIMPLIMHILLRLLS